MVPFLNNKRILLGITGSIAAYKSADLARRLRELGAEVRVAMTENAKRFITPLTMQAVSGNPIHDDLFDLAAEAAMGHIQLARWADLILIAPASADLIARLNHGNANDLLTTICLATRAPIALAPAMNQGMWKHTATQINVQALQQRGIHLLGPGEGNQACGDIGPGRMLEPAEIIEKLKNIFTPGILTGKKLLVTAGPTHEAIDPIRFITNGSSGKMGYALAQAARDAGASVTLISGPVSLPIPPGIDCVQVVTAQDMFDAVMKHMTDCDIFLAVAAVSDYRSKTIANQKVHKDTAVSQLELVRTQDIVSAVSELKSRPFIVGFAAETENVLVNARAKRERKKMDMIIANEVNAGIGMGCDENNVTVITQEKEMTLGKNAKTQLAREIIEIIGRTLTKERKL